MSNQPICVEFVTEESTASDYVTEIEKSGGKLEDAVKPFNIPADLIDDYSDAQFEPLILVAAAVAVGFLIKRISDVWLDHTRPGGQVIDTQGNKIVVRVAPYLERGMLVLQSKEGVKVFRPQDRDEALPLLEKVILAHG
jgi:hypothetical protein